VAGRSQHIVLCVFFALVFHAALVLGLNFRAPANNETTKQMAVTLSTVSQVRHQPAFTHLAQTNQSASGDWDEKDARGASLPPAEQLYEAQKGRAVQDQGENLKADITSSKGTFQMSSAQVSGTTEGGDSDPLTQSQRERLSALQLEYAQTKLALNRAPRVLRIHSQPAKATPEAEYMRLWRNRIEAIGNQYYPESSRRYGIYGDVRVLVAIGFDGRLLDTEVIQSSGHAVLDQAVLKIVRLAAPYPPFPPQMRQQADQIEIVRTWEFKPIEG